MWEMYDRLLEGIPGELMVTDYCIGLNWTCVQAGKYTGVAVTVQSAGMDECYEGPVIGEPLKKIAGLVKSWDFAEASLGEAAINCWYNSFDKVSGLGGFRDLDAADGSKKNRTKKSAFPFYSDEVSGKNVVTVGHFPDLEAVLKPVCHLSILERDPEVGDYPDSACEYIMQDQDYAFITGMTLINKTLPRLLELTHSGRCKTVLVGPSAPITPILHDFGVAAISGFCVTEPELLKRVVYSGNLMDIFDSGFMISADLERGH